MKFVKTWLALHARQLAVLILWSGAMVALFKRPQWKDEIVVLAGSLQLVGMQLPPFTFKAGAEAAAKLVGGVMLLVLAIAFFVGPILACTSRQEAKTAYEVQQEACRVAYDEPAKQKDCVDYVRNRWTEAGAPTAAQLDGGSHE